MAEINQNSILLVCRGIVNSLQPKKGPFFGLKKFLQEKLPGNQKILAFLRKRKSVSPTQKIGLEYYE